MSAKAFLESVLNAQRRIESMQERANTYRELAASVGGGIITGSHGSGFAESHIEKHMNAYMLIIEDIEKEIEQLRRRIHDVTEAIACLPDVRERELLELRYLNGMRWIDMVKRLGYEDRQLRRIHDKALENIQRDMDLIAYARKNPLAPAGSAACVAVQ
jgi:DNA-directed RNA polymerase specialized sigma subunit